MNASASSAPPAPLPRVPCVIVGVGARTHAGLTPLQVTLAARAGKMRSHESHMIDKRGEPMAMCRAPWIADNVFGWDRYVALASSSLAMAAHPWLASQRLRTQTPAPIPMVLATPPRSREDYDPRVAKDLLGKLADDSGVPIDLAKSTIVPQCRGGGVAAYAQALTLLAQSEAVIVGGVDSYFHPDVLEALDTGFRLHSLDAENGFIPGEAAAFTVLARRGSVSGMHLYGQILGASVRAEPRPYGNEEPCHALGMTAAIKEAVHAVGVTSRRVPWALTDVANERHRVDEWQLAFGRCFRVFTPDVVHDQPLLKTGDVGAASAALLLVMACVRWQIGAAVGDAVLIGTHSDASERGALLASEVPS